MLAASAVHRGNCKKPITQVTILETPNFNQFLFTELPPSGKCRSGTLHENKVSVLLQGMSNPLDAAVWTARCCAGPLETAVSNVLLEDSGVLFVCFSSTSILFRMGHVVGAEEGECQSLC